MKLLLIEDEIKLAGYLKKGLSEEGFVVDICLLYTSPSPRD